MLYLCYTYSCTLHSSELSAAAKRRLPQACAVDRAEHFKADDNLPYADRMFKKGASLLFFKPAYPPADRMLHFWSRKRCWLGR